MVWGIGWGGITPSETDLEIANEALYELGQDPLTPMSDPATAFADTTSQNAIKLNANYCAIRDKVLASFPFNFAVQRKRLSASGILDCSGRTITFIESGAGLPDKMTDSEGDIIGSGFESSDIAVVSGSSSNNNEYKIRVREDDGINLTFEDFEDVTAETLVNSTDLKIYAKPAYGYSYKYPKPADCLKIWAVNDVNVNDQPQWAVEASYVLSNEIDDYDQIRITYIRRITDATKFDTLFRDCFKYALCAFLSAATKENLPNKRYYDELMKERLEDARYSDLREGNPNRPVKDVPWQKAGR